MKEILLTQGQVALVDDEDFDKLSILKWYAHWSPKTKSYNALHGTWDRELKKRGAIKMHRTVLGVTDPNVFVDHINHDTLDNRKENLRIVNNRENMQNLKGKQCGKFTSRFPGVSWSTERKKWYAVIYKNGKSKNLGRFTSELEAALAYQNALLESN